MNDWFSEAFSAAPLMAILRGFSTERTLELADTAWSAGISCVEVPIQSTTAVDSLAAVAAEAGAGAHVVGAGTVTTIERVRQAAKIGAAFTVAPGFDDTIALASEDEGMPHLPGVATASEAQAAERFGAKWVKAFPASVLGTEWFKAMKGPFPNLSFVATGGIDADNAATYFDAGASAIAIGSAIERETDLQRLVNSRRGGRQSETRLMERS